MIDSQILNDYQACPCKTYYRFIRNVRPLIKESAFDKGGLLHYMMKYHYKLIKHNQTHAGKQIPYADIMRIVIRKAEKYMITLDLDIETCQKVLKTYDEYAKYYANEAWQIIAVEQPFARVIYEDESLKIIYTGIIDLATNISVVDTKTSERRGEPTGLSNQFMGYAWAFNVNNVVINKVGFQKTLPPEEKFERYTKSYPAEILEEWKQNTIREAKKLYLDLLEVKFMEGKKNFTSCDKYGGCIFSQICGTIPEARDFVIQQKYKIGEAWEPVKTLETK